MKQLCFCRRILGVLILSVLPLFAQAAYSVLHYSLPSGGRVEVHFNESKGVPPIQILLFAPQSSSPIALSVFDKAWPASPILEQQKYIFPLTENQNHGLKLPAWVSLDIEDSSAENLRQGILVVGDHIAQKHATRFLHVFPLEHILKHPADADAYHLQEPPRTPGAYRREYSAAVVEDNPSSSRIEPGLLLSIRDEDPHRYHPKGTMLVTKTGQLQRQTSQWVDLSGLAGRFQFSLPSYAKGGTYKKIIINDQAWGQPVKSGDGSPYPPAPEGPSEDEIRRQRFVDQSRQLETQLDAYEPQVERESNLTHTLLKLTGIDKELATSRWLVMGYTLRALPYKRQSQHFNDHVLTAMVRNRKSKKVTARSWVVSMDLKTGTLEHIPLPSEYTVDDLYQFPSGQIILRSGENLDFTPHVSCLKAHPF